MGENAAVSWSCVQIMTVKSDLKQGLSPFPLLWVIDLMEAF